MDGRILFVFLPLACLHYAPAHATGDYPLSCKGWSGTITERRGINSAKAIMRGVVTRDDLEEYCDRDPGGETDRSGGRLSVKQCVAKYLASEGEQELVTIADCQSGRITFRYGNRTTQTATFPLPADSDTSCASPLSALEPQFQMLCPAKAAAPSKTETLKGSDRIQDGLCLELKVDGVSRTCDDQARIADNGAGTVDLISGFRSPTSSKSFVFDFTTAQKADLENSYGYALSVTSLRTMDADQPKGQEHSATGVCFMVKPMPHRIGSTNIKQEIVLMCSAQLSDTSAGFKRPDWKFVF